MVKNILPSAGKLYLSLGCLVACLCLPSAVHAAGSTVYREISKIEITAQARNAVSDDPNDLKMCAGFKLSTRKVKQLLQSTREIDVRAYAHDVDVSPCTVEGQVTLRNGLTGKWLVQMGGGIRVEFEDQRVMLLHCKRCGKPFAH